MVELKIYNINNVQPEGFTDHVNTKKAPIFLGFQETRIETENPVSLKDDDVYLIRPIQEIFYPKYKLQFIVDGEYWVEQLRYARKVVISQDNESDQNAIVTDFTRELIREGAYKVDMTYYDRSDPSVVEYFKSSWLSGLTQEVDLFAFQYSDTDFIYTRINPVPATPAPDQETYDNSDKKVLTKSLLRETDAYLFYLSAADLRKVLRGIASYECSISGVGYQAEVLPSATYSQIGGADIYKVEIDFIYNIINSYK